MSQPDLPAASGPSDEALAELARSGSAAALEELTQRYRPRIYAYALGLLLRSDDAEDVVQDTFIRVCRSIGGYRSQGNFSAWIFRIATNLCRDQARRRRRAPEVERLDEMGEPHYEGLERQVAERLAVAEALERLSPADREVLALNCLEGLSPLEIAQVLGSPRVAVRVRLWRARARLARELSDWLE